MDLCLTNPFLARSGNLPWLSELARQWCLFSQQIQGTSDASRRQTPVSNVASQSSTLRSEDSPELVDESLLIRAILNGERERYTEVVLRYQAEISRRMWKFTRVASDHQELVQEVFVQAYLSLSHYREEAPFGHWLQRIASRTGYRFWKLRRNSLNRPDQLTSQQLEALGTRQDSVTSPQEAAEVLHLLLQRLSPEDRLVVTLLHLEEYSVAETAAHTGFSEANVKVRAHRARQKLSQWLQETRHESL